MQQKKIGSLLLSGLMIGPILGSGIIIIPPAVYGAAGEWALPAWAIMIVVGFFFAFVFGFLTLRFPGEAGVTRAVAHAFGEPVKRLAAFYLIGAVLFGPVAVLLTAARYANPWPFVPPAVFGGGLLCLTTFLLMREIASIGRIAFVISTSAAGTLFLGGLNTILFHRKVVSMPVDFDPSSFGYGLLLLFWTMVGWEVVGNYSGEVRDPKRTIPRAIVISALAIAAVSLVVAAAVQWVDVPGPAGTEITITTIIRPLFGGGAAGVMGVMTLGLCLATYLMFTGSVARLTASLAREGILPPLLGRRLESGAPVGSILLFSAVHLAVLAVAGTGPVGVEGLVALADGFFIANALIGVLAAAVLLENRFLKCGAGLLALFFLGILLFSSGVVITVISFMAVYTAGRGKRGVTRKNRPWILLPDRRP